MDVVAEGCNCATDGWFPSPILLVLIATVALAGSVATALWVQRRTTRQPSPADDVGPRVAKGAFVTTNLRPSPPDRDQQLRTADPTQSIYD